MAGTKSDQDAIWLAVPVAFTNFAFTILGVFVVEKMGRRKLLLSSLAGVICSLLLLTVTFYIDLRESPSVSLRHENITDCTSYDYCYSCVEDSNCGFCYSKIDGDFLNGSCLPVESIYNTDHDKYGFCNVTTDSDLHWAYDHCPFALSWLAVLALVLYLAWFAPGMGPMPWTVNSEIYPQWARSFGNASSATTNWVSNLLVSITFLHLTRLLTKSGAFGLYTVIAFIGWLFIYSFVPETKGKTLEEVNRLFERQGSDSRLDSAVGSSNGMLDESDS
jgi:SP family myo-inositol transporter-like MFS transporter 13